MRRLLLYALRKQSRKTGKKAPSGKDDAVFEELFLFVRFGIEVIELPAVKGGLFIIVEGRDGNFSAAGAVALSAREHYLHGVKHFFDGCEVVFLALEIIADLFEHCFIDLVRIYFVDKCGLLGHDDGCGGLPALFADVIIRGNAVIEHHTVAVRIDIADGIAADEAGGNGAMTPHEAHDLLDRMDRIVEFVNANGCGDVDYIIGAGVLKEVVVFIGISHRTGAEDDLALLCPVLNDFHVVHIADDGLIDEHGYSGVDERL